MPRFLELTLSLSNSVLDTRFRSALGRMAEAGLKAFAARDPKRTGIYSFENQAQFDKATETRFKANKAAWKFFQAQPPGYQRLMVHRIMSAKREDTRARRLGMLIAASAKQVRIDLLTGKPKPTA